MMMKRRRIKRKSKIAYPLQALTISWTKKKRMKKRKTTTRKRRELKGSSRWMQKMKVRKSKRWMMMHLRLRSPREQAGTNLSICLAADLPLLGQGAWSLQANLLSAVADVAKRDATHKFGYHFQLELVVYVACIQCMFMLP